MTFARRFSLSALLSVCLSAAFLPAGALAFYQALTAFSEARSEQEDFLSERLSRELQRHEALFERARGALRAMASGFRHGPLTQETCEARLEWAIDADVRFDRAFFAAAPGADAVSCVIEPAARAAYNALATVPDRPEERPKVRAALMSDGATPPLVYATLQLRADDRFRGTLGLGFDESFIGEAQRRLPNEGRLALAPTFDRGDGLEIQEGALDGVSWRPASIEVAALDPSAFRLQRGRGVDGGDYFYGYAEAASGDFVLLAAWPIDEVGLEFDFTDGLAVASPLLTWALAVLAAAFALRVLVIEQLDRLSEAVRGLSIGRRRLRTEVAPFAPREFVELTEQFDRMSGRMINREALLEKAVYEQRSLVREVHHRVRNNLQIIYSLISLEKRRADPASTYAFARIQGRVRVIALVYKNLYSAQQIDALRLDELLKDMTTGLFSAGLADRPAPPCSLDAAVMSVDIEHATPIALFVAEALLELWRAPANSGASCALSVALSPREETGCVIEIACVGCRAAAEGWSVTPDIAKLMDGYARQLSGRWETRSDGSVKTIRLVAADLAPPPPRFSASLEAPGDAGGRVDRPETARPESALRESARPESARPETAPE